MDYNIRCPDCGTKTQDFSVWRAVTFFCIECNAPKFVALKALGKEGRKIQRAVDRGQLDLEVPNIKELKNKALVQGGG